MSEMVGIGSNKKIIDIYNQIKSGELILQPDFQRKLVWNKVHKENFIDTILKGLPFPEIYTSVGDINLNTRKAEVIVVDGQQRLNTIYEYIEEVDDAFEYKIIPKFSELDEGSQKSFFYYVVVVRDLGHISIEEVKEIFKRINSVDYALESMEINNALYDGEYITVAKEILKDTKLYDTFKDKEIARMKDLEFILAVMVTYDLGGYFAGYKEVEAFVKNYNDKYPNKDKIIKSFMLVNELIGKIEFEEDSIWINSRSCYFTLLVELLKYIDKLSNINPEKIGDMLNSLSNLILQSKNKDGERTEYSKFYKAMYEGTASRKNRAMRGEVLANSLIKVMQENEK